MMTTPAMSFNVRVIDYIPTYNAVARGIAESKQVPIADIFEDTRLMPNYGNGGDNTHANSAPGGGCLLTGTSLQYGSNVRNLRALEMLTRAKTALLDTSAGVDSGYAVSPGAGTVASPILVLEGDLPFTRTGNTAMSSERTISSYSAGCSGATQNEIGAEVRFKV